MTKCIKPYEFPNAITRVNKTLANLKTLILKQTGGSRDYGLKDTEPAQYIAHTLASSLEGVVGQLKRQSYIKRPDIAGAPDPEWQNLSEKARQKFKKISVSLIADIGNFLRNLRHWTKENPPVKTNS